MTITELRQDAPPGFDEFVAAEGESLLRLAFLLTTETEPAVIALDNALARTYGAWPRLAGTGHPEDFVRRALVSEAADSHRARRATPVAASDNDNELVVALRALPPDERAATVLRHCLDLSEMETAATLGCTVGAVRRQTMRALARLRDLLPGLAPSRAASYSLVDLMRHLQASLSALPDRLDLRPTPDLLSNIHRMHARRTLRRRAAVLALALAACLLVVVAAIVFGATNRGSSSDTTGSTASRASAAARFSPSRA